MKAIILGGTGTLGQELTKQLLEDKNEVICLSRCELKQKEMKAKFPNVKYVLGDIRDKSSLARVIGNYQTDIDIIYHVAALKHIDIMEENPEESVKTNILGTMNVASIATELGIEVIFSSTDKAQYPVNVYGMSKGISEKIMLDYGHSVFRWGNVIGSRGSALHYFVKQVKEAQPINLTHMDMTRFWIRIEDAVKFMITANRSDPIKKVKIPPMMKASKVISLIYAIEEACGKKSTPIKIVGLRAGEKIHEDINEDTNSKTAPQYTHKELVELVRPFL